MKRKIELTKINENGKQIFWQANINGSIVSYRWGQTGGKIQEEIKHYTEGKNIGRSNETTPQEQCAFEVFRKARKKVEKGYSGEKKILDLIDKHTNKEVQETNLDVPKPTLANDGTKENHKKKIMKQSMILAQPKIDGNRALVNLVTGKIFSRSRKEIKSLPHLGSYVQTAMINLTPETNWADGELYSHDITFNEIQSIVRKKVEKLTEEDIEKAKTIGIRIFDYISDDEQFGRTTNLEHNIIENDYVQLVKSERIRPDQIQETHDKYVSQGYEGVILRFTHDGGYQQKRSNFMYKWKNFIDIEAVVIGFKSEKQDSEKLGSVELQMKNGKKFNARPAMTDEKKQEIWDNQDKYFGMDATIVFQEYDAKSGIPRFPVLKSFRNKEYN